MTLEPLTEEEAAAYRPTHRHSSPRPQPAIRLGLSAVLRLTTDTAQLIAAERAAHGPYVSVEDLVRCATGELGIRGVEFG